MGFLYNARGNVPIDTRSGNAARRGSLGGAGHKRRYTKQLV